MVAIAPFRALRFAATTDLATATCPPHDCIPEAERDRFRRHPGNMVHLVLPEAAPTDADDDQRFRRATAWLKDMTSKGLLTRDARPSYYLYTITTGPHDDRRTMKVLLARLRLDPTLKQVRPHELILRRAKRDRLSLRRAVQADVEPIWLLYRDPRGWVEELLESNAFDELARFVDEDGDEHRLWRVERPEAVGEITAQFDDRTVVIADGHHRYQTALDHHAETGRDVDGAILVGLVRDNDPGLRIVATHRLVSGLALDVGSAMAAAAVHWDVRDADLPADPVAAGAACEAWLDGKDAHAIVVARQGTGLAAHVLRLRPGHVVQKGRGRLDELAVTRAHERLLQDAWGIDLAHPERHLRFTRDAADALRQVATAACQFAVLLPPEPVSAVLDVAAQDQLMPQKATYFVPKLRSGIVLSPLDEPAPRTWAEQAGDGGRPDTRLPRV